jgi:signal transduction histidine kinase
MNNDVLEFSNAIVGGTVWTHDLAARAAERIRRWFRGNAQELHDILFQGFFGASLQLQNAVEDIPSDSPGKPSRGSARPLASSMAPQTLEEALCCLRDELTPGDLRARVFVTGRSKALKPAIQEQLYLIGREALVNALRHSNATSIEAEVEYLPRQLRVVLRDNGCGIDPQLVQPGRDGHSGLLGMRERAASIGAKLRIWSKLGCGTEVEICVPGDITEAYE